MERINDIIEKTKSFAKEMQKDPHYAHILCNLSFSIESSKKGITFSSNAGIWLANSNTLSKTIKDFIHAEYEQAQLTEALRVDVKMSKISNLQDKKEEKSKTKDPSKVEEAIFITEKPKYKLEDVILSEDTFKSISDAISTIQNFDMVYNQWNFKSKEPSAKTNICFFGSPGTGKTMCAHAIADQLGKDILIASYADIQSQYVGVGPKNLRSVFQKAEEHNAVLFFDEADSFLRKRTSDNSSSASMHYNSMTNEMMKHLEDFNGVVIFATNLTENTDEAFKTRLSYSIEFKVPDEECRAKIISRMIPSQVPIVEPFSQEDYIEMSKVCDGMVGRDIRNAVKTILSVGAQNHEYPFTKEQFIEGFKKYKDNKASFDKESGKKSDTNPMDIYTANGCIHNLLTYAAWIDGKETDLEAEYLKTFSKILSRNKLVINSVSDLPEFEEICHEIKDEKLKKKALRYLAYFMANTGQSQELFSELSEKLIKAFSLQETEVGADANNYFLGQKNIVDLKNKL